MSVYNKNGNVLAHVYNADGAELPIAYDAHGNAIHYSSLKVATYNVGSWYIGGHDNVPSDKDTVYYALQNKIVSTINADILLLEEYTKQFSKLPRTAKSLLEQYYQYIHEQGGDSATNTFGRCICSKYPISNYTTHLYSNPNANWYYDSCNITVGDKTLTVIITHIYWTNNNADTTRDAEIQELVAFANTKTNVIIGGDFNNGLKPDQSAEDWNNRYNRFVKPFIDSGYNTANYDAFGVLTTCIDTNNAPYAIDNIYTSENIDITNAYVNTEKLTDPNVTTIDHMPLIATVQLN